MNSIKTIIIIINIEMKKTKKISRTVPRYMIIIINNSIFIEGRPYRR